MGGSQLKKINEPSPRPSPASRERENGGDCGIRLLLAEGDYARLKSRLSTLGPKDLGREFEGLPSLEKLVVFKLLDPPRAMEFYSQLSFQDKYLVLCGFDVGAIAPVTENLSPAKKALFEKLDATAYRAMVRQLAA